MASPSTVISLGYGSFGSANLLPTLGYGVGSGVAVVYGGRWVAGQLARPTFAGGQLHAPSFRAGQEAAPGFKAGAGGS